MLNLNKAPMGKIVEEVNKLIVEIGSTEPVPFNDLKVYLPDTPPALLMLVSNKMWHDKKKYGKVVVTEDGDHVARQRMKQYLVETKLETIVAESTPNPMPIGSPTSIDGDCVKARLLLKQIRRDIDEVL